MTLADLLQIYHPYTYSSDIVYRDVIGQTSIADPYNYPNRLRAKVLAISVNMDTLHVLLDWNFNLD